MSEELGKLKHKCLQKEITTRARAGLLRRLVTETRGQDLIEFAFVLPILVMLLLGMVWMGRAISVYQALGRAARDGARAALAPTCATCGDTATGVAAVTTVVTNDLTAASLNAGNAIISVSPPSPPIDPADNVNYRFSGVTVNIIYPVQLNIPFTPWNGTTISLNSTVTMRQEF
jgi:Flp pilus assembly protein TadG